MATKSNRGAVGVHINSKQQIIQEIINPQIDYNREQAISKSPEIRVGLIKVPGMRDTLIQFKEGTDPEIALQNFIERTGKTNTGNIYSDRARASRNNRKEIEIETEL